MGSFADRVRTLALALGGPGLFLIGFLDSSFISLPEINDILLIWMVTQHKTRMVYYATCATLGSLAGCLVLYYVGRKGDQWIARRFSAARVERAMATFQRYGVMAVLIPSLLPPPAPFKIFVLLAGVAAVPVWQFTAAVFTARFIRYFGEGLLAVYLGDEAGVFIQAHAQEVGLGLAALALAGGVGWILWQRRKKGA